MPSEKPVKGGSTPFPDFMVEKLMPRLRDTEWRLICVILRQTLGWHEPGGKHKLTDWLSHGQLRRKTGRSSAALSVAIEFLCRNRLIEITTGDGQSLMIAPARRKHRGRLYFKIDPTLLSGNTLPRRFKSRIQKVGTTTRKVAVVVVRSRKPILKSRNVQQQEVWRNWERVGETLNRRRLPSVDGPKTD